jgi:hypothetical protein
VPARWASRNRLSSDRVVLLGTEERGVDREADVSPRGGDCKGTGVAVSSPCSRGMETGGRDLRSSVGSRASWPPEPEGGVIS